MEQEKVWDTIASKWTEFRSKASGDIYNFLMKGKGKLLDVGCGSGRNFMKKEGIEWSACDFSKKMLEHAKRRAKEMELDVKFRKATAWKLPYDDESFDHCILYAVLHCIDSEKRREKTLKEVYRILKTNGSALISVWGTKAPRIEGRKGEMMVPWEVDGTKVQRYTYIYGRDEIKKLISDAGFEIIYSWEDRNLNLIVRKK